MLDMGFIPDIEFICDKLPTTRQTMLFSATMPPPIKKLADKFLSNPKQIEVSRAASTNENIAQFKVNVAQRKKREGLKWFLRNDNVDTAIVFSNKKVMVRELAKALKQEGFSVGEIHGDMDQGSRIAELDLFKAGDINILVASDVAARGLDVKGVSHVFNYDTPWHPDDYVHRIGRTGRAGAKGRAITFVTPADAEAIDNVEKLTGGKIPEFDFSGGAGESEPTKKNRHDAGDDEQRDRPKRAPRRARNDRDDRTENSNHNQSRDEGQLGHTPRRPSNGDNTQRTSKQPRRDQDNRSGRNSRDEKPQHTSRRGRDQDDAPTKPGEWNGPIPGFLGKPLT